MYKETTDMFTGIVEEIGTVKTVLTSETSARITISCQKILKDIKTGDSISTNGVCLTAADFNRSSFSADVMAETMRTSNLSRLNPGDLVNLERALQVNDRLGGHFVSGHIDGTGIITNFTREDNAVWVSVSVPPELLKYIVHRGSVTLDGISLTAAYIDSGTLKVSVIPHTNQVTALLKKHVGDSINIECDLIGKYVEKLVLSKQAEEPAKTLDLEYLKKYGFA